MEDFVTNDIDYNCLSPGCTYNCIKLLDCFRSGLIQLIHLWNKDVETFYEDKIVKQKEVYSER